MGGCVDRRREGTCFGACGENGRRGVNRGDARVKTVMIW